MPYTYTNNTPNAADPMNVTQPLILNNFKAIQELVAVNHVGFNTSGFGTHNVVEMPYHAIPATPEPSGINMFTKATGSPNAAEIFGQYPTGTVFQISGPSAPSTVTSGTISGSSWCLYPTGVLMKWGSQIFTTSSGQFFFPTGAGVPTFKKYAVWCKIDAITSMATNAGNYGNLGGPYAATMVTSTGPNGITWVFPVTSGQFNWFVIGM